MGTAPQLRLAALLLLPAPALWPHVRRIAAMLFACYLSRLGHVYRGHNRVLLRDEGAMCLTRALAKFDLKELGTVTNVLFRARSSEPKKSAADVLRHWRRVRRELE